jgi:hypothetical protein
MRMLFHFRNQQSEVDTIPTNPEWVNYIRSQWQLIKSNKKYLAISLLIVLMVTLLGFIGRHKHGTIEDLVSLQNKRSESILHELSDINATLHNVSSNPANAKQQEFFRSLEKEILTIQQSIVDVARGSDIQKVARQIALVKDDVDSQINDLKKAVSENTGNKQYLDVSALPFHVISVDVIAEQSYVSVDYANHILPFAISDFLAGWRVVSADYDSGIAEFVNEKNQYVKVSLQGV